MSIDEAFKAIPEGFRDVQIRTIECGSDGSVPGLPKGTYWYVRVGEFGVTDWPPVVSKVDHQGTQVEAIEIALWGYVEKAKQEKVRRSQAEAEVVSRGT